MTEAHRDRGIPMDIISKNVFVEETDRNNGWVTLFHPNEDHLSKNIPISTIQYWVPDMPCSPSKIYICVTEQ